MFRTRQAPSPTGYLHFGTARQILFTALMAKANHGQWYLRLEDTDRNRLNKDAATGLLECLDRLHLMPEEGITLNPNGQKDDFYGVYQAGQFGPYIQSERLDIYHTHAQNLIDKKLAYWSYLSETEMNELQEIKQLTHKAINYYKINSEQFSQEELYTSVQQGLADSRKPALKYRLQRGGVVEVEDVLLGKSKFDLNLEEDFNILKSDGFPTYHLAHLVDDKLMETTLVIRAQEWYPSIARHVTMFKDYWGNSPKYIHLPFIMGETGTKKMSKRDGNVNMADYLDKGYLPEAILNYLAFLGWNPGTDKELYLTDEDFATLNEKARVAKLLENLSKEFDTNKFSKSAARFSLEKLNWFNKEYFKKLSLREFVAKLKVTENNSIHNLALLLDKNRVNTLSEVGVDSQTVLNWQKPEDKIIPFKSQTLYEVQSNVQNFIENFLKKAWESDLGVVLESKRKILHQLATNSNSGPEVNKAFEELANLWQDEAKKWFAENGYKVGEYMWPVRVLISGKEKSPSPFEFLAILEKEEVLKRLKSFNPEDEDAVLLATIGAVL